MTYRAGARGLAAIGGAADDGPRVICDGCGAVKRIPADRAPPLWFLDGQAPPGWRLVRDGETRDDRCPKCRKAKAP